MKRTILLLVPVFFLAGCNTVVRCGVGTIAVPDGVDPDGPGFFVAQDGDNYVKADGTNYKNVTCQVVAPVTVCGASTAAAPATAADSVNPDGGGFFVDQDGGGFFVAQDDSVQPTSVCVLAEPADP